MPTHKEMVELHAQTYHSLTKPVFRSKEKYVLHLMRMRAYFAASQLCEGRTVLDLGCNIGEGSAILHRTAKKVVGVDVSESVIASARNQFVALPIEFVVVDGISLPFPDGSFDMIASFQVIEHIVDQDIYLSELKRVLRPGGIALFTTPNAAMRLDAGMAPWNAFHVREFAAPELEAHLKCAFKSVQVMGLFAEEPLYSIEINRTLRIRANVRKYLAAGVPLPRTRGVAKSKSSIGGRFGPIAQRVLPNWARRIIRHALGRPAPTSTDFQLFLDRYGLQHLAYRADQTDRAMDLIVICSDEAVEVQKDAALLSTRIDASVSAAAGLSLGNQARA